MTNQSQKVTGNNNKTMSNPNIINLVNSQEGALSQDYKLSICLRSDGFLFSLIDKDFTLKTVGEFSVDLSKGMTQSMSNLRECFASIGIRLFNFAEINIVYQEAKNTFIPYKLYDDKNTKEYLREIAYISSSETVLDHVSTKLDTVSVFSMPMQLYSAAKILMPKANFYSQHQIMAEYCFEVSKLSNNTVLLYKRKGGCDLVVFKATNLVFSNSFSYNNENDMIYQLLFTFEQIGMDVEDMNFLITGEEYSADEKTVLSRHIKDIMYANPMELIKVENNFGGVNLQNYFLTLIK